MGHFSMEISANPGSVPGGNQQADLKKEDFGPVVAAFREFTSSYACDTCGEMYSVSPERGKKEALRCGCGKLNLNLLEKGA
ncbi:hypothetical protein ATER59S_00054 [Aquamicrobium terrae]